MWKSRKCLDDVLGSGFDAVLQCDGYAAYESHARKRGLVLAACWAHARRKFHAAKDYDPGMVDVLSRLTPEALAPLLRGSNETQAACAA